MRKVILVFSIIFAAFNLKAADNLVPFVFEEKVGYMNTKGDIIIRADLETPINYQYIVFENDSFPTFSLPKWAYFSEDKATIRLVKKILFIRYGFDYAVINTQGELQFAPDAHIIHSFQNDIAVYQMLLKSSEYIHGEQYGLIDLTGKFVIEPKYTYLSNLTNEFALALLNKKYIFIDTNGTQLGNLEFPYADEFSEGLAAVQIDGKMGYINTKGDIAIKPQFDNAWRFSDGLARIFDGEYYGFVSPKGKLIDMPKYTSASDFSEGLACVKEIEGKYGYIDKGGKYIIPPNYYHALPFSEGLAAVKEGRYFSFIDKTGKIAIQGDFDYAESFSQGVARVWIGEQMRYINKNGETIYVFDGYEE